MNVMEKAATPAKRPGRPLSFDREEVLGKAMLEFWRTGYETTSISDLTRAMGVTAPSLYSAFGDKEGLFLECVQHYNSLGPKSADEMIAEAPSAREAARLLLESSAQWFTQPDSPPGCLIASSASTGSEASGTVRAALTKVRHDLRDALRAKAEQDIEQGRLPATAKSGALASMAVALIQGMSTLARDGARHEDLREVVRTCLTAWPNPKRIGKRS